MATHRRARALGQHSALLTLSRAAATLAAATAVAFSTAGSALADPGPSGGAPTATGGVRNQLDGLYAEAESAGQRYDGAREQEATLQRRSVQLQQRVAEEQQQVNTLVGAMGAVAGAEYRQGGGMDPVVQLLFSAHPAEYLDRATTMDEADSAVALQLHRIEADQRQLAQDRATATAQLTQLDALRKTIAGSKAQAQRRLGRAKALLDTLDSAQRASLRQDEGEAAGSAALLADAPLPAGEGPASDRAAEALAAARSAIGKPYVYGSAGPGAFDCSGLMYWSWRHAGVTLPRTSQGQAYAGRRIPLSQARPGDLVIFYDDMHHVGMYAGNGMVIHAPYPGASVRYERAADMPVAEVVRV